MPLRYTCDKKAIEMTLEKMKADGLVSIDAFFNYDAPENLRREVAYKDFDFLTRLCRIAEAETVDSIFKWLVQAGIVDKGISYPRETFNDFRGEVKAAFNMPGTSISPVMERLLYMLSAVKMPEKTIGLGTYYGYALVWVIGASCGRSYTYTAEKVYGVDIDDEATEQARSNFNNLAHADHVELIADDGFIAIDRLEGPFDYVYIDVDNRELGKHIYLDLIARLYSKIKEGGWVLAHDTTATPFARQLEGYLSFVRDKQKFQESISFHIDPYGLELSIK